MIGVLWRLLVFVALCLPVFGAAGQDTPRTAVVNIQEIFREYHKSVAAQEEINLERARIQKENNDVQQRLQVMDEAIKTLQRRYHDPVEKERRNKEEEKILRRELAIRMQEREALEGARKSQIQGRHGELNRKMVARMQAILEEIRYSVQETGRKAGYDYVFDMAGLNTSQVPSVLYAKDAIDITGIILKELNKNAPLER